VPEPGFTTARWPSGAPAPTCPSSPA